MEAATQKKTEVARFVSKGRNYRAILLNEVDRPHHLTGEKEQLQKGFTAEFSRRPFEPVIEDSDGSFQWPPPPDDPYAEFVKDGIYVDPISHAEVDVVARLRAHPDLNVQFVELGPDPAELQREQSALLGEIQRAAVDRDVERLADIYDSESGGRKREPIMTASMEALRAAEDAIAREREPG